MKNVKKIILILGIAVVLIGMCIGLNYAIFDDGHEFSRNTMHDLYQEDNIDVLFLGSFNTYTSFDTPLINELTGLNTFNAGICFENLEASYYLLQEFATQKNIHKVYIAMYYDQFPDNYYNQERICLVSDYMHFSVNKIKWLAKRNFLVKGLLPFLRGPFDLGHIKDTLKYKTTDTYKKYEPISHIDGKEVYESKGFIALDIQKETAPYQLSAPLAPVKELSTEDIEMIHKIMEFGENNDIEITFIATPIADFRLKNTGNYDAFINSVQEATNGHYVDFNLLDVWEDSDFSDTHHLMRKGAAHFSEVFVKYMNGESLNFYSSFNSKMDAMDETIFGLIPYEEIDENRLEELRNQGSLPAQHRLLYMFDVSNARNGIEYQVTKITDESECIIKEFSEDPYIMLPEWETGILIIEARIKDTNNSIKIELPFESIYR